MITKKLRTYVSMGNLGLSPREVHCSLGKLAFPQGKFIIPQGNWLFPKEQSCPQREGT